jgi:DNA-binding NarL/FixJ family response regulator
MTQYQPIFATAKPLRIAALRQLLVAAGIAEDPRAIFPEELPQALAGGGDCLVIVDGESLPPDNVLVSMRRASPGSRIVIWTDSLSPDLLRATLEFGLDGLLSSKLPLEDAAYALARICRGERLMRFDSTVPLKPPAAGQPLADATSFDAQWMLHGVGPHGREK